MKLFKKISVVLLFAAGVILSQCKKDEIVLPDVEINDTISSLIDVDKGSIGLLIDTRSIAKKGYTPEKVKVQFSNEYEKFSRTADINPGTFMATLKYYADSLTSDELNGFQNGVPITIIVYGDEGEILNQMDLPKQQIDAAPDPLFMESTLPAKLPLLKLNSESLFIVQSEYSGKIWQAEYIDFGLYPVISKKYELAGDGHQEFYFRKVPDGGDSSYYIISFGGAALTGRTVLELQSGIISDELTDEEVYIIRQDNDGMVKIRQKNGYWFREDSTRLYGNFIEGSGTDFTRFRLLNADLVWAITDLGTNYDQPILPQAKLEFAYKATLRNCSGAILTEKIGRTESRTQSFTSGTEESIQLFTSHESSVDISAGVDVEASFFGNGAVYSFEVSAGYTYTTSSTNTSTEYWESTETSEVEISREREIQIGPDLAVEAYDAVQTISNVRLPFTKKFRIKAKDSKGTVFNGEEIRFQLYSNRFEGVVTDMGADYVDFTIKGTTSIDRMMEVDTRITEIEGGCE